jgi:hypothetical protein
LTISQTFQRRRNYGIYYYKHRQDTCRAQRCQKEKLLRGILFEFSSRERKQKLFSFFFIVGRYEERERDENLILRNTKAAFENKQINFFLSLSCSLITDTIERKEHQIEFAFFIGKLSVPEKLIKNGKVSK